MPIYHKYRPYCFSNVSKSYVSKSVIVRYYQVVRKLLRFTRKVQFFVIMRYDLKHSTLEICKLYAATFYATAGKKKPYWLREKTEHDKHTCFLARFGFT